VLVILAAAAACSKRDDSSGTELLAQDRALVARLEVAQEARQLPLPDACGTVTVPAQPTVADQQQAEALTKQALVAEMHGDVQEVGSLLRRAAELDATNKSAAYHLGRTSETLGDRDAAVTAYCRYLALTPTIAESVEARQRVAGLSKVTTPRVSTRVAAGSVTESAQTARPVRVAMAKRVTRAQPTPEPRFVRRAPVARSESAITASGQSTTSDVSSTTSGTSTSTDDVAAQGGTVTTAGRPTPDQPSGASSTSRRGPSRAQSAGIGAATGAIIGAATGRSVKSAVIGGAAGGILGAVVGGRGGFVGRGIVP
jgi:hypothetical protein